jgi:hypothetical protein
MRGTTAPATHLASVHQHPPERPDVVIAAALELRALVGVEHDEVDHAVHVAGELQQAGGVLLCVVHACGWGARQGASSRSACMRRQRHGSGTSVRTVGTMQMGLHTTYFGQACSIEGWQSCYHQCAFVAGPLRHHKQCRRRRSCVASSASCLSPLQRAQAPEEALAARALAATHLLPVSRSCTQAGCPPHPPLSMTYSSTTKSSVRLCESLPMGGYSSVSVPMSSASGYLRLTGTTHDLGRGRRGHRGQRHAHDGLSSSCS